MSLLISFFGGMLLGRFRVFILVPTTLILLFFVAVRAPDRTDVRAIVLLAAVIAIALQMGYLSGIVFEAKVVGGRTLPLAVCLGSIIVTTIALVIIDSFWETKHLIMAYLLPAILMAIYYDIGFAVFTSFGGGIVAAYILLPPKFSFQIGDSLDVAELEVFMLLALVASETIEVLVARDR